MIANFTPSLLRLSQLIIVCGLLLLSACSYIDKLSDQQLEQEISTEQRELLQLESAKPKIDKSLQQQSTSLDIESPTPHSPIYCSKSGEYPDQLPSVALSFYEASVRDVFAEMSLLIDFPIVIDEFVEGVVTIETNNIRLDKALDLISATSNLSYRFFNEYILVGVNSVDTPSWASLSITCRFWPQYVSAELLFNSLGDIEKEFVFYPKGSDYLSISAPPGIQRKIQESLFVFDHSPGQVLLELSIVEITATDINRLGIRWHENNASLAQGIIGDEPDLIQQLQLLARSGQTQIKAMPSLLSGHGKKAKFSTMQQANQWQVKGQDQSKTNRTQSFKKEEREILEYGVQMEIVPYIIDSDTVTLNIIDATVSDLVVGGDGYLQLIKHRVSNQVTVDNGEFILLGGMMQQSNITHTEGIPKLKNIPLLGRLFGQKKQRNSDYEIWIMIRPSILKK
jgi:type II secretory pathway component GspD/PulD (secretin)